ncbi:MAG: N,N-dimethylformamidase beta subunit family domain-containing protein [Pseudomonadota bacterium]
MKKRLAAYRKQLVVHAGERVDFCVHAPEGETYQADLVRVCHGDPTPGGPGTILDEIAADFAKHYPGAPQPLGAGSFGRFALADGLPQRFTLAMACQPMLVRDTVQTIADLSDDAGRSLARIELAPGGLMRAQIGNLVIVMDIPLPLDRWALIGLSVDGTAGTATLHQTVRSDGPGDLAARASGSTTGTLTFAAHQGPAQLTLASQFTDGPHAMSGFNGRLEAPLVLEGAHDPATIDSALSGETMEVALLAGWDFGRGPADAHTVASRVEGRPDGRLFNLPVRAVRGLHWSGHIRDFAQAPEEYAAIHFHDTDLYDAGWETAFSYNVPDDLPSGIYAARFRLGEETDYAVFFVTPRPGTNSADRPKVAFVAPTASYLAYANEVVHATAMVALMGEDAPVLPEVRQTMDTPAFGRSMYEAHDDGSGVHYSSWLRPIWNLRPDTRPWAFPADTNITYWLEQQGVAFDIVTDHDILRYGHEALAPYTVLLTGTHPEYLDHRMFDAYEEYLEDGGRLMYLGGNGFYWNVGFSDTYPEAMEVRRAEDGNRGWVAPYGEYYQAFDGRMGGLWRRQGRPPNRLVGVGFTAQGFTDATYYRRTDAASDPRCAFIFDGLDGDIIGAHGLRGGGAAGEEIDRFDPALGSPAHALVIATSEDHPEDVFLAKEEFLFTLPPNTDPRIRADVTFFETESGGAVFSTGSIAWSGALFGEGTQGDISRITANVLTRFSDPTPFDPPPQPEKLPIEPRGSVPSGQRFSC